MTTSAPGSPGGQSFPASAGTYPDPSPPIDFATSALQTSGNAALADVDHQTTASATSLASIESTATSQDTHLAAIDTSTAATAASAAALATIAFTSWEVQHVPSLGKAADQPITFAFGKANRFRISNYDTTGPLLVKLSAISGTGDTGAARVGAAVSTNVPTVLDFPIPATTVHVYTGAAANTTVTVEGFK